MKGVVRRINKHPIVEISLDTAGLRNSKEDTALQTNDDRF